MKLTTLYEQILIEILDFNNIELLKYTKVNNNQYKIKINNDLVEINFYNDKIEPDVFTLPEIITKLYDTETVHIGYTFNDVDTQFKKMPLNGFLPILKTIVEIVNRYIIKIAPKSLVVFSTDRYGSFGIDPTKDTIYKLLIKKYAPATYACYDISVENLKNGLILVSKQFLKR